MRKVFALAFFLYALAANASSFAVCPSCDYQNIEAAYKDCHDGDTLIINGGEHKIENWTVEKSITIKGEKSAELISTNGGEIITVEAHDVTINGLRFSGVVTNYLKENAAIRIKNSRNFKIVNNTINDCFFAIYLQRTKEGLIYNNTIKGNATTEGESGNGIHAWNCDSLVVEKNRVSQHRDGIYFEFVNNSKVIENISFENKRYGLHYMFSNDDTYTTNIFRNNGVGVAVMFSRRIEMKNNIFSYNWGQAAYGLLLKEIYDAEIIENVFEKNTIGIFVEGSNRINYLKNEFKRNGWAMKFSGGCETNIVSNNHFLYNSIDLVVSSKINDNSFDHNYWSEYAGYDLDKDGVGDVPHYPVKLYSYILNQVPESVVLMRSLFVDLVNFAEKTSPVFTPKDVIDHFPQMSIR